MPIAGRAYRLADFFARPKKKAWCHPFPPPPKRVEFIGHGKSRRLVCRLPRDGKAKQKQQPVPNLPISPALRAERGHHLPARQPTDPSYDRSSTDAPVTHKKSRQI